jgi:sulfatase modifying factor 1
VNRPAIVAGLGIAAVVAGSAMFLHTEVDSPTNRSGAAPAAPPGMVYVPGGTTHIGAEDGAPDERPVFAARVKPFFMDSTPVTVAQFRAFVQATGHVTSAERVGDAAVLDLGAARWTLVPGASWHHPLGPAGPAAPDDHPVTQVSWHDATAYAAWAGKRLPTEIEWEHAARGGQDARARYAWGPDSPERPDGGQRVNIWQGSFPAHNTMADGFLLTSPVGTFGATSIGLSDMAGNVWEWTDSWYRPYADRDASFAASAGSERVQRGGSFLCHEDYCHGYRVSARSHSTPETALFHVGFRLVMDLESQ